MYMTSAFGLRRKNTAPAEESFRSRRVLRRLKKMLKELGFAPKDRQRICWLVGHHHTYRDIKGMDYQILVEADFLVNLYEDQAGPQAVRAAGERIFRTAAGRRILERMFAAEP